MQRIGTTSCADHRFGHDRKIASGRSRAGLAGHCSVNCGWALCAVLLIGDIDRALAADAYMAGVATASSTATGSARTGANEGDRFSVDPQHTWRGVDGAESWWWQVDFPEPRLVGAILQVNGDQPTVLANSPRHYFWQWSADGQLWHDLPETVIRDERRLFRLHRCAEACRAKSLRIVIHQAWDTAPVLREVELYADASAVRFPDWIIAVSTTTEDRSLPGPAETFVQLARQCDGWQQTPVQVLWLGDFDEAFVAAEPRPLCAMLSGNYLDWCQQAREPWRGVAEVLRQKNLPLWAACGGAQALTILQETGVDRPWDCPRCRDPHDPKLPVYSHIGHTGPSKCGEYSQNVWERGICQMRLVARDPVFAQLPEVFDACESHVGQIAYVPSGWIRVVTNGPGALTENQCLRMKDRYIYAAQFHIEMAGTPENSQRIMGNFLRLAREWGGYNPQGPPIPVPEPCNTDGESLGG